VTADAEDLVARSAALLESVGFRLVPLAHPIGAWPLLAVSPRGLTMVCPVREKPNLMGATYTVPAGWPAGTVRLVGTPMQTPSTGPPDRPHSVRTVTPPSLVGSRCPVCKERLLRGRQTVCSGRCRAKRWRAAQAPRDPEIRATLEAIAQPVQGMLGRLEKGGLPCARTSSGRSL
jgi:hypothetical protein